MERARSMGGPITEGRLMWVLGRVLDRRQPGQQRNTY
jgi:hypothetical protein